MLNEIEDEWLEFLNNENNNIFNQHKKDIIRKEVTYENKVDSPCPTCSDIYISTKTKISYLNKNIDLDYLFWLLPIIEYHEKKEGIIKKQMKFQSFTKDCRDNILNKTKQYYYYKSDILYCIDNPNGKIKFKDTRKISIGISKKDIINIRCKVKSAFYNCFVLVFRIVIDSIFKEIHIKIFNTGKLEIPGIKNDKLLNIVLDKLITIIQKINGYQDIKYHDNKTETVLINSNFNCGYYIDRELLYSILRNKYNINCSFDPCSYPGIQCQFYYNTVDVDYIQNGCQPVTNKEQYIKISFMIFRTGSVLMVGKCSEEILNNIYLYIRNILYNEYSKIHTNETVQENRKSKQCIKKHKKKFIYIKM